MYSPSINNLISALKKLPSVGERTAERFVFYLLKSGKRDVTEILLALKDLVDTVKSGEICWNFSDTIPCPLCRDTKRDQSTIAVVLDPQDLMALEQSGAYHGVYHVLRALLDPTDETSLERMKARELLERIKGNVGYNREIPVQEVILALNPDLAGETTMLYLEREIKTINPNLTVTRLARGLPMGGDLRYTDEITLGSAIKNRIKR